MSYKICPSCGWEMTAEQTKCPECGWGKGKAVTTQPAPSTSASSSCVYSNRGIICKRLSSAVLRDGTVFCAEHYATVVLGYGNDEAVKYYNDATASGWAVQLMKESIAEAASPVMRTAIGIKDIDDPDMKKQTAHDVLAVLKKQMKGFGTLPYNPDNRSDKRDY